MSIRPTLRLEQMARTRQAVTEAARARFGAQGFANASLDDIARDAGATTGALYHHFANKRALFAAVAEALEADVLARLAEAAAAAGPPSIDLLLALLRRSLALVSEPDTIRILLVDAPNVIGYETWRAIEMRYGLGAVAGLLTVLSDTGAIAVASPGLTARILLAMLIEAAHAAAAAPDADSALEAGFVLIAAFVESLASATQAR